MKKFAKILSILCALALIASSLCVGFVASAAEAVWSSKDTLSNPGGTNHFANGKPTIAATDGNDWAIRDDNTEGNIAQWSTITNGTAAENEVMISASSSLNTAANNSIFKGTSNEETATEQTAAFLQVTVDLKGTVSQPERFYYSAHNNSWGGPNNNGAGTYISAHYEIFASNNLYDLYDAENSLYVYKASAMAGKQHTIDISSLDLPEVKFFGVRFYHRAYANYIIHLTELGLFGGTYTASKIGYTESMEKPTDAAYSTNNHLKSNGTVTYVVNGAASGTGSMQSHYYNGAPDGAYHDFGFSAADNRPFQTNTYMQYEYTLDAPINSPETFFIAAGTGWDTMASQRWTLFASNNKANLYNDESIVYEYLSNHGGVGGTPNNQPMEQTLDISELNLKNIKYVAIRFYHRSHDSSYTSGGNMLFISELGLYGGTSILTDSATYSDDENNAYNYGANRLANSTATTTTTLIGSDGNAAMSKGANVGRLTDGSTALRNQIQAANIWDDSYSFSKASTDKYIQVTFALGGALNNPEKFLIAHDHASLESNPTVNQWYEIFASDTEADLYENSLFVYKNTAAKMVEQQIDLSDMDLGTVKYFGIRFYHLPSGCLALPSEIALYGGETIPVASITTGHQNYSVGTVYTTYGQNHLEYAIGEAISTDGTTTVASRVALSSVNGILDDISTIAAGDATVLTADNNGLDQTAAYLQLQYTLNAPVDNPEKFVFIHHKTFNGSYNSAHYAVFASDSLDTLYDKALYEFKADAGVGNTHVIDISEFELQNVKYAAIRLYHRAYNNCKQHIEEFGLYGGTMEAGFDTNSTAAFPNTSRGHDNILKGKAVSAVSDNGSAVVPFEDTDSYLAGFTDDKTADDGTGAKYIPGLEQGGSFKVTYDLGGTLNNPTTVNFQAGWGVEKPYTVYASATLEDLYNAENAIVEVAGYTGGVVYRNITTDITEKNLTGIKYIGLKVDATNNTMMHITEFAVKGGTYTEDPKEPEVSISLGASVFASTAGQNANDITYKVNVTSDSTIVDMGIISGFKVNIDADAGFQPDTKPEEYAEYLKTAPATAIKVSATAEQITNPELYFHVTNSGKAGNADYSGYKLVTIAYVIVEFEGEEYTYYSNVVTKSSMMISRNQAKNYKAAGYVIEGYEGYAFATDATIDIAKVREYVEAVNAMKAQ